MSPDRSRVSIGRSAPTAVSDRKVWAGAAAALLALPAAGVVAYWQAPADPSPATGDARVIAQGECAGDGSLFVKITRNGTVVFSGGNGVGIVTAIHQCQGSAVSDYVATWSTGQIDEGTFPCG